MSAQLIKTFAQTNKTDFSLAEITRILKEYFGEDGEDGEEYEANDNRNSYRFLKTKWYYGYKNLLQSDVFKHVTLRILHTQVALCRNVLGIDDRQKFNNYDKSKTENIEFDLAGCPSYTADSEDIYVVNPSIKVVFANMEEFNDFRKRLGTINITDKTKTVWFPSRPVDISKSGKKWLADEECKNKYPIYIPSYKRADNMLTVKSLLDLKIDNFFVVIKPTSDEVISYTRSMEKLNILDKLLIVSEKFINEQEAKGNFNSIPQRNFAYDHSVENGFTHHWCLDDNISGFFRREQGTKLPVIDTAYPFVFIENYLCRYQNVNLASMQYNHLCPANGHRNIIIKNSKVYSCILIKNSNNIHWRGSYNEDIVLTLDTLTQKKATLTFQNFLCGKQSTGRMKGGNTDIYNGDGQTKKINELLKTHPKYVTKIIKYGHDHHQVNYAPFKNIELGHQKNIELNLPELILSNN
tara:strand:+ start:209 stop:1606 length:1398 start_codon:yes stop_codon:yes gene_type:complete